MRLLLDTHVMLWAVGNESRLRQVERDILTQADNEFFVSTISIWEVAIKHPFQRGSPNDMPIPGREVLELCRAAGFVILPVAPAHASAVDDLPPLSGDPFDRMLIAQATIEGMRLMTRDTRLAAYGAMVLAV